MSASRTKAVQRRGHQGSATPRVGRTLPGSRPGAAWQESRSYPLEVGAQRFLVYFGPKPTLESIKGGEPLTHKTTYFGEEEVEGSCLTL
jgi:hypothetical protein